jgi:hypothetical protein
VQRFQAKGWGWWYLSIGIGFLLLAIVHMMQRAAWTDVALRIGVAVGFALLGWMQLRFGR